MTRGFLLPTTEPHKGARGVARLVGGWKVPGRAEHCPAPGALTEAEPPCEPAAPWSSRGRGPEGYTARRPLLGGGRGGRGGGAAKVYVPKMAQSDFPNGKYRFFPRWSLWTLGGSMTRWCVLVCCWLRLLADRPSLPFPWTLSLHRRWCPSASHRPVSFLSLLGLSFSLYFPFISLGRLCQWSPGLSLVHCSVPGPHGGGQLPRRWPGTSRWAPPCRRWEPVPNSVSWALGCPVVGSLPQRGHITTFCPSIPMLSPP